MFILEQCQILIYIEQDWIYDLHIETDKAQKHLYDEYQDSYLKSENGILQQFQNISKNINHYIDYNKKHLFGAFILQ